MCLCVFQLKFSFPGIQLVDWIETTYEDSAYKPYSCKTDSGNPCVGSFFLGDDAYNFNGFPCFKALKENIALLDSIICAAPQGLSQAAKNHLFATLHRGTYKDKDAAAIVASLQESVGEQ